ncbi:MAG TPA: hypothetical protein DCK95_03550 [Anaerolineaceae bacterium]|nr:hypothetical protein [Anaerolineaceae bacterium]
MLQENESGLKPPKIVQTLVQGFNLIAAHPYIMLFPLLMDLFFWFGPFYRIKNLLTPTIEEIIQAFSMDMTNSEVIPSLDALRTVWDELLTNFNLLSSLRTYPIGVPSLLATKGYSSNPVGNPLLIEVGSSGSALQILIVSLFIGILIGSIYYALISRLVVKPENDGSDTNIFHLITQSFLLFFLAILMIIILSFPILCFLSSVSVFLPTMGTIPLIILGVMVLWTIMPLVFSPHGIFTRQLSAVKAISLSTKFVRVSSLATTFFITIAISLSYGLDLLWSTPEPDSWLYLLGLIGHAFVSSGVLAASFIYFRDGTQWMEEIIKLGPQNISGLNM